MLQQGSDLFIWGGDNIYANSSDPARIQQAYRQQQHHEDYAQFASLTPIIGTWDDHDFAYDNANGSYQHKDLSQSHFLDFIGEPKFSARRFQQGIFTSYSFGSTPRQIKIILLDNRYFKDLDPAAPLLGQNQWSWLEQELKSSQASLHIIVSGLSVLSPRMAVTEEWEDYPSELNRLLGLVEKYRPKGLIFLSGDKHFSSIFSRHGQLEFMASGMTHNTRLPLRPYIRKLFNIAFFEYNYGQLDIKWKDAEPELTLAILDQWGVSHHTQTVRWQQGRWLRLGLPLF